MLISKEWLSEFVDLTGQSDEKIAQIFTLRTAEVEGIVREGEVLDQRTDEDVIVLRARLDDRTIGRLRQAGARITVLRGVERVKVLAVAAETV